MGREDDLQRAKSLIQKREYDKARRILRQMSSDPTARKWLVKLNEIAPPAKTSNLSIMTIITVLLLLVLIAGAIIVGMMISRDNGENQNTAADQTLLAMAPTLTRLAITSTPTQTETVTPSPSPTETPTPTLTETPTLTATIDPTEAAQGIGGFADIAVPTHRPTDTSAGFTGEAVDIGWGTIKVLSVQRPTSFTVFSWSGFSLSDFPVAPIDGTQFVSVEIELTCGQSEITCTAAPVSYLILQDGRTASADQFYTWDSPQFSEIASGRSVVYWNTYAVPIGAAIQSLAFEMVSGDDLTTLLPPAINGLSMEMEWVALEGGGQYKRAPRILYGLLGNQHKISNVNYLSTGGIITLAVTLISDEVIYFDELDFYEDESIIEAMGAVIGEWTINGEPIDYFQFSVQNSISSDLASVMITSDFATRLINGQAQDDEILENIFVTIE